MSLIEWCLDRSCVLATRVYVSHLFYLNRWRAAPMDKCYASVDTGPGGRPRRNQTEFMSTALRPGAAVLTAHRHQVSKTQLTTMPTARSPLARPLLYLSQCWPRQVRLRPLHRLEKAGARPWGRQNYCGWSCWRDRQAA